jgi:hypothetical protein
MLLLIFDGSIKNMAIKTPNPSMVREYPSMVREYPSMSQVKKAQISTPPTNNTTVLIDPQKMALEPFNKFHY